METDWRGNDGFGLGLVLNIQCLIESSYREEGMLAGWKAGGKQLIYAGQVSVD